jgi:alkylated DNA repair dioxygenase AlkB
MRSRIEAYLGAAFEYVFINRYRNGNHSVARHSDNDGERNPRRIIASLSLRAV